MGLQSQVHIHGQDSLDLVTDHEVRLSLRRIRRPEYYSADPTMIFSGIIINCSPVDVGDDLCSTLSHWHIPADPLLPALPTSSTLNSSLKAISTRSTAQSRRLVVNIEGSQPRRSPTSSASAQPRLSLGRSRGVSWGSRWSCLIGESACDDSEERS